MAHRNILSQHIFIPIDDKENQGKLQIAEKNLFFYYVKCFSSLHTKIWPWKQFRIWKALRQHINLKQIDVVHAHTLVVNGSIAWLVHLFYGKPYVVTVRNTDINTFIAKIPGFKYLLKPILNQATEIAFLSPVFWENHFYQHYGEKYCEQLKSKVAFIPNGLNPYWINNPGALKNKKGQTWRILFVGAVNRNKNLEGLLNACNLLTEQGKKVILGVVGAGRLEAELFGQVWGFEICRYGHIADKIVLQKIYADHDMLVVPSHTESFGLVYAEALSQGLPVIYTQGQGFDQQFKEGEIGFHVNSKSTSAIAIGIAKLMDNYNTISTNCVASGLKYRWETTADAYQKMYETAYKKKI